MSFLDHFRTTRFDYFPIIYYARQYPPFKGFQSMREARPGPSGPKGQPACFGCYIEMENVYIVPIYIIAGTSTLMFSMQRCVSDQEILTLVFPNALPRVGYRLPIAY